MNTRERVLKEALNCVNGEREKQYGNPEDNFSRIADLWSVYLTSLFEDEKIVVDIDPIDVAKMMILFKIARSNGDKDKLDNYVDILGYGACAAEIFENENKEKIFIDEWAEAMKGLGSNGEESDARQKIEKLASGSLDCEHCKYEPMDSREYPCSECDPDENGGTLFESDERKKVEKIELAEECKGCDYAEKCAGTGVCLKEKETVINECGKRILDNFADHVNARIQKKTEEKEWFNGCGLKKDKPDEKCNRKDCGHKFDACMTAYQHYMYNKTKEASEAVDECMCDRKTDYGSYLQSYNNISACIVRESSKANVNPCDVVDNLTRKGNAPTEMAALLANGKLSFDNVASYIEDTICEIKKEGKSKEGSCIYVNHKVTDSDKAAYRNWFNKEVEQMIQNIKADKKITRAVEVPEGFDISYIYMTDGGQIIARFNPIKEDKK